MAEKSRASLYFMFGVIVVYVVVALIDAEKAVASVDFFFALLIKIAPLMLLIFSLMVIANYYLDEKIISRWFTGRKGVTRWLITIVAGILSSGPIYMWYPLLAQLKEKGLGYGYLACFMYNRAIKIPLLPVMIAYFGLRYVLVLTVVMIMMSYLQGIIAQKLMDGYA
ncbi:hypothetical protein JXB31_03810 [Candidatus Woesearchaeota archaeon]|nr:hypothetical protein [Candidatus Woesearchaeota archaeon]